VDAASGVTADGPPESGDLSICLKCHHLMAYDDNLKLRDLNDAEIVEVAGNPDIILGMKMLGAYDKWRENYAT
jgi:hypothetical protein